MAADPGPDLAVVEPRRDPDLELDRPADALEHAQDPPGVGADRVVAHRRSSRAASPRRRGRGPSSRARACRRGRSACTPTAPRRSARSSSARRPAGRAGGRTRCRSRTAAGSTSRSIPRRDERGAVAVADQRVVADRWVGVVAGHRGPTTRNGPSAVRTGPTAVADRSDGRRYCGAPRDAPPLPSRRPRPARRDFAGGVGTACRVHGRRRPAATRRDADHGGAAIGGAWAQGLERLDGGDPQRLLRRLCDRAPARWRAGRPLRRPPPGAGRPRGVRGRRRRRRAHVEHRRADRDVASCRARAPGSSARRRSPAR